MIARSGVNRIAPAQERRVRIVFYAVGGAASGLLAGAALGLAGGLLGDDARATIAALLALAAIVVGTVELTGRRVPLLQIDRETPFRWYHTGPIGWALRNGAAIGLGAGTRLGFWLWYAIPIGAFISASPLLGALGYGLYALTRTAGVVGVMSLDRVRQITGVQIIEFTDDARIVTSVQLIVLAIMALLAVGS